MLEKLLKRLGEMFPGSDYHSRLEQYIVNRHPQSTADVEHWERRYFEDQRRGLVWNIFRPYTKQWSETVNTKPTHISRAIATTTDLHCARQVAINIVNAKSQNIL